MSTFSSTSNPSNNSKSKTLSKKAVYLPLAALDHKVDGQYRPDAYLDSRNNLPGNVQEKALVNFWHKVSVDYHRNATYRDSRNNGNRAGSLSDMEENVRSRAVALIAGGIHTGWDTSSSSKKSSTGSTRQELSSRNQREQRQKNKHAMHFSTTNDKETQEMREFLVDLNALWNEYMVRLLQLPSMSLFEYQRWIQDSEQWARITACMTNETAQVVGARVNIKVCRHSPAWVGRIGYIVGKTKNTWNVMVEMSRPVVKKKRKRDETSGTDSAGIGDGKDKTAKDCVRWKSLVVPKKGSELTLLIPIEFKNEPEASKSQDDAASEQIGSSTILAIDIREDGQEK